MSIIISVGLGLRFPQRPCISFRQIPSGEFENGLLDLLTGFLQFNLKSGSLNLSVWILDTVIIHAQYLTTGPVSPSTKYSETYILFDDYLTKSYTTYTMND